MKTWRLAISKPNPLAVFLFALLLLGGTVFGQQPPPPKFIFAPGTNGAKFDTDFWMAKVWPLLVQISTPRQVPTAITIDINTGLTDYSCGTQTMNVSGYPNKPQDLAYYHPLTHELGHALSDCQGNNNLPWDPWIMEGTTESRAATVYRMMGLDMTYVRITDTLNNLPVKVCSGNDFHSQNCFPYPTSAGLLEMVAAKLGSFKPIDEIRNSFTPDYPNFGNQMVALLDGQFPDVRIDGLTG